MSASLVSAQSFVPHDPGFRICSSVPKVLSRTTRRRSPQGRISSPLTLLTPAHHPNTAPKLQSQQSSCRRRGSVCTPRLAACEFARTRFTVTGTSAPQHGGDAREIMPLCSAKAGRPNSLGEVDAPRPHGEIYLLLLSALCAVEKVQGL